MPIENVSLFCNIVKPKSKNEDLRRREFILNVILLGTVVLGAIANIIVLIDLIRLGPAHKGIPPEILLILLLIALALYLLSRAGFFIPVAYILIGLYFTSATYTAYAWGADIPQGLLTYALIIVMAGVLISTRFAFVITLIATAILGLLMYLQTNLITHPDLYWRDEMAEMDDVVTIGLTFGLIALISWLSNREIERSLKRARRSEAALKNERDLLAVRVEERTRELKQTQLEKMLQLYRFAKFGRLASGLFHDLANPLTNVHLNLERLSAQETSSLLKRALNGVMQMEGFVGTARKQIQEQETETKFSAPDEIKQAIQMLAHRAKEEKVEIRLQRADSLKIYGNPLKFYQLVTNLLSNAIDAYGKIERDKRKRQVLIELKKVNGKVRLAVQDWGCGIPKEQLGKIFDPFFTTKPTEKGIGIGLCICKDIVEKDFGGRIKVKSTEGKGSTFTLELPAKRGER